MWTIAPAFAWAYNEELEPYPYDPERARQLLEEAGYEGDTVTFYVTEGGSGMLDPVAMGTRGEAQPARKPENRLPGENRSWHPAALRP